MGCENSKMQGAPPLNEYKSLRKNKKKVDKVIGKYTENQTISENVV